jgi:D-alanyl-D-alanine endopeptidase (penicillin-binding protein 7)
MRVFLASLILVTCLTPVSSVRADDNLTALPPPVLRAGFAVVRDELSGEILFSKNGNVSVPIASISKLMTALVVLDAHLDLAEPVTITADDVHATAPTHSVLSPGTTLSRDDLLHLALMASDNRAAVALGRSYPGGMSVFVATMNARAADLGMPGTHFDEPSGLSRGNVSTAEDLARLVSAADRYALIGRYSTDPSHTVLIKGRPVTLRSTNALVRAGATDIAVQKTGFTRPAGQCLVLMLNGAARRLTVVLLDAVVRHDTLVDTSALRRWLEPDYVAPPAIAALIGGEHRAVRLAPAAKARQPARANARTPVALRKPARARST